MNDKKTKKTVEQKKHVFQINTMHSDNEAKAIQMEKASAPSSLPVAENDLLQNTKKPSVPQKRPDLSENKKQTNQAQNPFLAANANQETKKDVHEKNEGSFAPGKKLPVAEKINYTPEDIVRDKKTPKQSIENSQKKMTYIIMIAFIAVFLLGAIGFGVYMLYFNNEQQQVLSEDTNVAQDEPMDILTEDDDSTVVISSVDDTKPAKQVYAINLPNYFSIDVESKTAANDIAIELNTIATNMQDEDITGPISFIVVDANNNPVSFHTFALSAEMDIPQDTLTSLEEGFEIYAYTDERSGVRFGFAVDAKNTETLQTALNENEIMLPKAFNNILNDRGTSAIDVLFKDSTYGTHPIRYYNLDESETYSVDYTINNQRFIIGTTKNTLRAMIDVLKDTQTQ